MRRTKIVASLGPATDSPDVLKRLFEAGVDVARMNFSHADHTAMRERVALVRRVAKEGNFIVAIMGDLQGPKIRVQRFRDGKVQLEDGAAFFLDASLGESDGDVNGVGLAYKELVNDVGADDILLLNDGLIELKVTGIEGSRIHTQVVKGGELSDKKGLNRKGGGISASALTEQDKLDIKLAAELDLDYMAVSFVRDAADVEYARGLLKEAGSNAGIVAKIERTEAVENLTEIVETSEAVMVARGDLGVEIGDAELPVVQKHIIKTARKKDCVVITATQMMESMITNPVPTRAEVMDVANAVIDGSDAVMLSGETSVGKYPVETVEAMARVCVGAERHLNTLRSSEKLGRQFKHVDEAIAMAAMFTANNLNVKAIVSLTESGTTALWLSRVSSGIPILALTRHEETTRKVKLYRGVYPVSYDVKHKRSRSILGDALEFVKHTGMVEPGDLVVMTRGDLSGIAGGTNTMKILEVPDF